MVILEGVPNKVINQLYLRKDTQSGPGSSIEESSGRGWLPATDLDASGRAVVPGVDALPLVGLRGCDACGLELEGQQHAP